MAAFEPQRNEKWNLCASILDTSPKIILGQNASHQNPFNDINTVLNALTHNREIQFMHILTRNYSKKIIQGKAPLTKIDQFWFLICVFETLDGICVVRVEPTQHREIQL